MCNGITFAATASGADVLFGDIVLCAGCTLELELSVRHIDSLELDPPGARERGVERHAFARRVRALDANVDEAALASRDVGNIARCLTPRDEYHHLLFCTFSGGARVHARGAKHRVLDASQIALPNAGVCIGDRWISEKTVDYF